jgi:hypothetical protein
MTNMKTICKERCQTEGMKNWQRDSGGTALEKQEMDGEAWRLVNPYNVVLYTESDRQKWTGLIAR